MRDTIRAFVEEGGDFDALALQLYAWQRAHSPVYDRFCGEARPSDWREIPAVPVGLFKEITWSCVAPTEQRVSFFTSGTTERRPDGSPGRRGVHVLPDTELYDLGSWRHAERVLGALPRRGLSLVAHGPHSSLGHMVERFCPTLDVFFDGQAGVDAAGFRRAASGVEEPVFVAATAFALAELLAVDPRPVALPKGSIAMVTGGFKGRVLAIDEHDLTRAAHAAFPGARVVGEYGMTELSSQLWSPTLGAPFVPPPWLGVVAKDPWSGQPVQGEGLLVFVDLCNHASVLAIETEDRGVVLPDGRVELRGRLPRAEARGCSLTVEEARGG